LRNAIEAVILMRSDLASLPSFAFGDGGVLADRLGALVVAGRKTGTCWSAGEGDKSVKPGGRWVVLSGSNRPIAVIETVTVESLRFDGATALHARQEGEGDLSLAFWRAAHEDYFRRNGGFAPDMPLYYETFRLVEVLDEEFAQAAPSHVAAEIKEAAEAGFSALP
jgi:uncharacterized protein YhfF